LANHQKIIHWRVAFLKRRHSVGEGMQKRPSYQACSKTSALPGRYRPLNHRLRWLVCRLLQTSTGCGVQAAGGAGFAGRKNTQNFLWLIYSPLLHSRAFDELKIDLIL
jgi:hypothetical protein